MSLNAWEQQALDSIKDGLTGSDPKLAAMLSAFTRLTSGEDRPDEEKIQPRSRRALRRLRRARWRATFRRVRQRLGLQGMVALLCVVTSATLIAVAVVLSAGGDHGAPCIEWVAAVCTRAAPDHGSDPISRSAATDRAPQQQTIGFGQVDQKAP